eukprot:354887-Chlamydomonas_euryale.AAC.1
MFAMEALKSTDGHVHNSMFTEASLSRFRCPDEYRHAWKHSSEEKVWMQIDTRVDADVDAVWMSIGAFCVCGLNVLATWQQAGIICPPNISIYPPPFASTVWHPELEPHANYYALRLLFKLRDLCIGLWYQNSGVVPKRWRGTKTVAWHQNGGVGTKTVAWYQNSGVVPKQWRGTKTGAL